MNHDDQDAIRGLFHWAAVGELSTRVSHDSNNLLAGILGQAELGLLARDPARMASSLESIVRSSRELKAMMERLLAFSKMIEGGRGSGNLLEIHNTMFALLERAFVKGGIPFEKHHEPVPTLPCEPAAAGEVMLCALRTMYELGKASAGGSVRSDVVVEEDAIRFAWTFTPSSGAMNAATSKAWDSARTAMEGLARIRTGSGIGVVFSEAPAGGVGIVCRFTAQAPVAEKALPRAMAMPVMTKVEGVVRSDRALSVLLVEDEPSVRALVQEILMGSGCEVASEADAALAYERYQNERFDLVMTDIAMPGMDGLTLIRKLREFSPTAMAVVITGRLTKESIEAAMSAGAMLVLPKPFEIADLRAVVDCLRRDRSGNSLRALTPRSGVLVGS